MLTHAWFRLESSIWRYGKHVKQVLRVSPVMSMVRLLCTRWHNIQAPVTEIYTWLSTDFTTWKLWRTHGTHWWWWWWQWRSWLWSCGSGAQLFHYGSNRFVKFTHVVFARTYRCCTYIAPQPQLVNECPPMHLFGDLKNCLFSLYRIVFLGFGDHWRLSSPVTLTLAYNAPWVDTYKQSIMAKTGSKHLMTIHRMCTVWLQHEGVYRSSSEQVNLEWAHSNGNMNRK